MVMNFRNFKDLQQKRKCKIVIRFVTLHC